MDAAEQLFFTNLKAVTPGTVIDSGIVAKAATDANVAYERAAAILLDSPEWDITVNARFNKDDKWLKTRGFGHADILKGMGAEIDLEYNYVPWEKRLERAVFRKVVKAIDVVEPVYKRAVKFLSPAFQFMKKWMLQPLMFVLFVVAIPFAWLIRKFHDLLKKMPGYQYLALAAVLALKLLAKGKFVLSMLFMIGVYAWTWGLPFAAGFVILLAIHEFGHVYVLRRMGIKASAPMFIPFVGAVIDLKEMPASSWKEAMVGLGGPLLGTVGALVTMILAMVYHSPMLQAIAYVGFVINLFNMLPMLPMDGGRIVQALSQRFIKFGFGFGVVATIYFHSVLLAIMAIVGIMEMKARDPSPSYYEISKRDRAIVGIVYLGLLAVIIWGAETTFLSDTAMNALTKG